MAIEILAPNIPLSIKKATLTLWVYEIGDCVMEDEVIVEIETEKLILEVIAPTTGIIKEIKILEGENVSGREILGIIAPQIAPINQENYYVSQ